MKKRKAPCVDLKTDVHKDERFEVLGVLAGLANRYEALGRMHALWSWCIDRGLRDAPDDSVGYVVPEAVVRRFLGPDGIKAILGDDCDEFALGERRPDGRIYLRGTSEYVADRRSRLSTAVAGGEATAASAERDNAGRFVVGTTNVQPRLQLTPASSSSSSSSEEITPARAHAIPPEPVLTTSTEPPKDQKQKLTPAQALTQRQKINHDTWEAFAEAHRDLRREGIDSSAVPWSPIPSGGASSDLIGRTTELAQQGDESFVRGRYMHVLAVRVAEARAMRTLRYMIPSNVFAKPSFDKALELSVSQVSEQRPRGGPPQDPKPIRIKAPDMPPLGPWNSEDKRP